MTLLLPFVGVVIGALVGLGFFGGLWWTTHRLVVSPRPAMLLLTSMLARFAVLALCLVGLARLNPSALVGALVGIVAVRTVMTRAAARDRSAVLATNAGSSNEST